MSASTTATASSTSVNTTRVFWERLWRMSGINFVAFAIIAYVIYGYQPQVGASADALVAFYDGHRTRILIAAAFSGLNVLNLMWFAAAIRTTLADAGQDGWGAAATASSTAVGALFLLFLTVSAALAFSHHRPRLGRGREPSPGPKSCYACWMVRTIPSSNRSARNGRLSSCASTTERSKEARYVKAA